MEQILSRVTICLENREMLAILAKIRELSGKNLAREKCPKTFLTIESTGFLV